MDGLVRAVLDLSHHRRHRRPRATWFPRDLWNGCSSRCSTLQTHAAELDEVDGEVLLVEAAGRRAPRCPQPNGERRR